MFWADTGLASFFFRGGGGGVVPSVLSGLFAGLRG